MIIIIVFLNSVLGDSMEIYRESLFELKYDVSNQGKICQYQTVRSPIECLSLCLQNGKCREITLIKENGEILCSKEYALCNHTNKYHFTRKGFVENPTTFDKTTMKTLTKLIDKMTSIRTTGRHLITTGKTNIETTTKTTKTTIMKSTMIATPKFNLSPVIIFNLKFINYLFLFFSKTCDEKVNAPCTEGCYEGCDRNRHFW